MSIKSRAFGWIQDPSDFESLRKVVEIFSGNTRTNRNLIETVIPKIVEERDGKSHFISELRKDDIVLSYSDLIGTSFTPRSSARCNGIIQAAVKGQRREFISDWPADNFLRWAHALNFITYVYELDSFKISDFGRSYIDSEPNTEQERKFLESALLTYPPVIRVLSLLETGEHVTKFDIGKRLGFIGENGFTSLPQNIMIKELAETHDIKEKNKIRSDWEGSSDKYARMICGWLEKVGLVDKKSKHVTVQIGDMTYPERINHSYIINGSGLRALRKSRKLEKNVYWELFATKTPNRDYIRNRRAQLLKLLNKSKYLNMSEIGKNMNELGFNDTVDVYVDDIEGFKNIGISVQEIAKNKVVSFKVADKLSDFIIPKIDIVFDDSFQEIRDRKELCRNKLKNLSHEYLSLIDVSFDGAQNRYFEMKTMALITEECLFSGQHLGGASKPDGIFFVKDFVKKFGVIVDTKAYAKGYSIPKSQADEMVRYVNENKERNPKINKNKWWEKFPDDIDEFMFLFVSSKFKGNFKGQLENISHRTNTSGASITAYNLLMLAEHLKSRKITINDASKYFKLNDEIVIGSPDDR